MWVLSIKAMLVTSSCAMNNFQKLDNSVANKLLFVANHLKIKIKINEIIKAKKYGIDNYRI